MKYKKKPIIIEAFRWTGDQTQVEDPEWIIEAIKQGTVQFRKPELLCCVMMINTFEGIMTAYRGDWIIKGVKDELYPCKNDIFEATYEEATNE